jgi:hypothetical protein
LPRRGQTGIAVTGINFTPSRTGVSMSLASAKNCMPYPSVCFGKQWNGPIDFPRQEIELDATLFVEFMLKALLDAIQQATATDQVTRIIQTLARGELGSAALMKALDLTHKPTFRYQGTQAQQLALDRGTFQ